jgi:hypothetical protein
MIEGFRKNFLIDIFLNKHALPGSDADRELMLKNLDPLHRVGRGSEEYILYIPLWESNIVAGALGRDIAFLS